MINAGEFPFHQSMSPTPQNHRTLLSLITLHCVAMWLFLWQMIWSFWCQPRRRCALIIIFLEHLSWSFIHLQFPSFNDSTTTTSKFFSDSVLVTYVEHSCKKKLFFDTLIALPNWNTIQWYWSSDGYLPGWPPKCPGYVDVRNCSTTIARVVLSCLEAATELDWIGLGTVLPFLSFFLSLSVSYGTLLLRCLSSSVAIANYPRMPKTREHAKLYYYNEEATHTEDDGPGDDCWTSCQRNEMH